ncbi:hypothetical protein MHO82_11400 [Vibrio sp. Of7-15]|uniref:hypothetical protein n=1 Tax=Vibrio sp. Of7-15 TaxID=2724879 RepID=UPI001EF17625|nr:hypothetical protein [Vibrio sp. Of7-15]MCG7497473.1 hypothetical protein [Vibrio sp. Of7-15]
MRFTLTAITAAYLFSLPAHSNTEPKALLAEAIQLNSTITENMTTKQKLDTYETIVNNVNIITNEHAGSNESIQLLSQQTIGNFDIKNIKKDYIQELTGYHDKVCEASPSFTCLGFVSLKFGNAQCESARNLNQLAEAHSSLKNAINVFMENDKNASHANLAVDSYQSCADRSRVRLSQWGQDYFTSELLPSLLDLDKVDLAKAAIENMETPYFKFDGVLKLQSYSKKPVNRAYVERLYKYIEEKLPKNSTDAFYASIRLGSFALDHADEIKDNNYLNYSFTRQFQFISKPWPRYQPSCEDGSAAKHLYGLMTDYQLSLYRYNQTAKKLTPPQLKIVMKDTSGMEHTIFENGKDKTVKPSSVANGLDACETNEGSNKYSLMTLVHGYLLADKGEKVAEDFWQLTQNKDLTQEEIYQFYVDTISDSEQALTDIVNHHDDFDINLLYQSDSTYPVYKKYVDFGNVCIASNMLFQQLKGTEQYNTAIKYMLTSPSINPNNQYSCGDEDLELLLN